MFQYKLGTEVLAGENILEKIGENAKKFGGKALLLTDAGVSKAGLTAPVEKSLQSVGMPYAVFDGVVSNPAIENVDTAHTFFIEHECDVLIAVGGGSTIDTAKSVAVIAANGGSIVDYEGIDRFDQPSLPVLAVPTTVGTGAEVSSGAVISDYNRKVKFVVISTHMYPAQAYLEPRLVENLPPPICAATGMDTLTHAIEAYVSLGANQITDATAIYVIKMVGENLRPAVAGDYKARYEMLVASCMAGICDANAGLGLVHALANTMGGHYPVPHGVANAVLLPFVLDFNLIANPKKFVNIAEALGENVDGLSERDAASLAVKAVRQLSKDVGIPQNLQQLGIKETSIPQMAEDSLTAIDRAPNPRHNNVKDLENIFKEAYSYGVIEKVKGDGVGIA